MQYLPAEQLVSITAASATLTAALASLFSLAIYYSFPFVIT